MSRNLDLVGTPNARDFGGYATSDGGHIRRGSLFRSGRLSDLTAEDQQRLQGLDVKTVIDFRGSEEAKISPSALDGLAGHTVRHLAIEHGSYGDFMRRVDRGALTYQVMHEQMRTVYRELAIEHGACFRQLFQLLINAEGGLLLHCSAGKDRTGFAVALIQYALGVPLELIIDDYLLTSRFYPPAGEVERFRRDYSEYFTGVDNPQVFSAVMEVSETYLFSAFDAIDEQYGDLDTYLEDVLGMTLSLRGELREKYVLNGVELDAVTQ